MVNERLIQKDTTLVAVCGLHMRGFPLEFQMREHGASFVRKDQTAPYYQLLNCLLLQQNRGCCEHINKEKN